MANKDFYSNAQSRFVLNKITERKREVTPLHFSQCHHSSLNFCL